MTSHRPLDHCFRYSGAPGTDPLVHAALIEVLMWRMLHERRQASPDLDGLGALERWVREQRETLTRAAESEDRAYRLQMLEVAAERVRGRLHCPSPRIPMIEIDVPMGASHDPGA